MKRTSNITCSPGSPHPCFYECFLMNWHLYFTHSPLSLSLSSVSSTHTFLSWAPLSTLAIESSALLSPHQPQSPLLCLFFFFFISIIKQSSIFVGVFVVILIFSLKLFILKLLEIGSSSVPLLSSSPLLVSSASFVFLWEKKKKVHFYLRDG